MRPAIEMSSQLLLDVLVLLRYAKEIVDKQPNSDRVLAELEELRVLALTPKIHIEGRRWYGDCYGNCYHTVEVLVDGVTLWTSGKTYGGGDMFLQTGLDWLAEHGHIPPCPENASHQSTIYLREKLKGTYDVTDVTRRKDLHHA